MEQRKEAEVDGRFVKWQALGIRVWGTVEGVDVGILSWRPPQKIWLRSHVNGSVKDYGLIATKSYEEEVTVHRYMAWDGMELEVWCD